MLGLDVMVNDERKPKYREGILRIMGIDFLVIDPPGPNAMLGLSRPSRIDTGSGQPSTSIIPLPTAPSSCFLQWFFVNDWNAFIRLAAQEAEFRWAGA